VGQNREPALLEFTLQQVARGVQLGLFSQVLVARWSDEDSTSLEVLATSYPFLDLVELAPPRQLQGDRGNYIRQVAAFRGLLLSVHDRTLPVFRTRIDGHISALPEFVEVVTHALQALDADRSIWVGHIRRDLGWPYFFEDRYFAATHAASLDLASFEYAEGFALNASAEADVAELRWFRPHGNERQGAQELLGQVDLVGLLHTGGLRGERLAELRSILVTSPYWHQLLRDYQSEAPSKFAFGVPPNLVTACSESARRLADLTPLVWDTDYLPVEDDKRWLPSWWEETLVARKPAAGTSLRRDFVDLCAQLAKFSPSLSFYFVEDEHAFLGRVCGTSDAYLSCQIVNADSLAAGTAWVAYFAAIRAAPIGDRCFIRCHWNAEGGQPLWTALDWAECGEGQVLSGAFAIPTPPFAGSYECEITLISLSNPGEGVPLASVSVSVEIT